MSEYRDSSRDSYPTPPTDKRAKKREKQSQKEVYRIRQIEKLHHQIYQIPPWSQEHLRALVLEYMASSYFQPPMHQYSLMETMRSFYRNTKNVDTYMKDLDVRVIMEYLQQAKVIQVRERALGTKLVLVVYSVNHKKVYEMAKEYENDRPLTAPPDPATFQLNRQVSSNSAISRDERYKLEKLMKIPSLFDQSLSLRNKELSRMSEVKSFAYTLFLEEYKKRSDTKNVEYCDHCTKEKCVRARGRICSKRHFRKVIKPNTEYSSGNCPHLNACLNTECKHIHYVEDDDLPYGLAEDSRNGEGNKSNIADTQWINCDLRYFDFKVLGKFNVVMADPPWDIHMLLPYGTLKDKEMLNLRVDLLQDYGLIFLWVTGRAMYLGRECLTKWGYRRVEYIVWIKTNQLNRLIITGRTGHWLNHTKYHCLVGIKGSPPIHKNIDCDVLVSKVRYTSRKPDEIYGLIERMCPGGRKIELFGRPHNCKPGWITLGNQLPGAYIRDQDMIRRYRLAYPYQDLSEETMQQNLEKMENVEHMHEIYNNHISKNNA